jgi:hypothetical protein
MKFRELTFLTLANYTDELSNLTYLKVLTNVAFETIKLPTTLSKYKLQHLIQPNFLLTADVVCTRKNWIIRDILSFKKIFEPQSFKDFEKINQINQIILKYLHEGQETEILPFLLDYFNSFTNLQRLDLKEFQNQISIKTGFGERK